MILHDVWNMTFKFLPQNPIFVEPVEETISGDAGLLIFRQWDEQLGWTDGFAQQLDDQRCDPEHSILEMVRSRTFGILAGYDDQNDHDALRSDAVFKLLANRMPDDDDLASQPTLSRFENAVTPQSLLRLEDWFIKRFVGSFGQPPREVTLDIDVFDDPTHGQQQLTLFHGYYKQYQYLVRAITCAENDLVVPEIWTHIQNSEHKMLNNLSTCFPHCRSRPPWRVLPLFRGIQHALSLRVSNPMLRAISRFG